MKIITRKFNEDDLPIVRPLDFKKIKDGVYQVRLYCLIDTDSLDIYGFLNPADFYDNYNLAIDIGSKLYNSSIYLIVTPQWFPQLYDQIQRFECAINPTK